MVNTERIELYCIEICIAADGLLACPRNGVAHWCGEELLAVVFGSRIRQSGISMHLDLFCSKFTGVRFCNLYEWRLAFSSLRALNKFRSTGRISCSDLAIRVWNRVRSSERITG